MYLIPTYIINLKARTDRRALIEKEFSNKPEFAVSVIEACEHTAGAIGLWQSIIKIVNMAVEKMR